MWRTIRLLTCTGPGTNGLLTRPAENTAASCCNWPGIFSAAMQMWLGRIARNLSLDRWKWTRAQKRGGAGMEVLLGELDDCVPTSHSPERCLEDQEIADLIGAFLRRLPPERRQIFLRRYWYGQELSEIAGALGCGQGKVKSSLFRTRKALRAYLEQEGVAL